jgi:carboxyl-terminal processing protease
VMKFKSRFLIVAVLVLAIGSVIGGRLTKPPAQATPSQWQSDSTLTRGFVDALRLIDDHHVQAPDKERLTKTAILGMLHTLDPHSSFFDRREFNEMQEEQSSEFYGIGVTINKRNGRIYVLGVGKGMPAEQAGLRYGDAIVAVNGKSAKDWEQTDALKHVRGERGTPVEITVERVGEPQPVTVRVVRDKVPYPSVRNQFMLRPGVGYIGLTGGFNKTTSEELRFAIAQLKQQGMNSLILDLRRNPGGLLKQAIQVSEEFLPRDVEILTVRGREEGRSPKQVHKSANPEPETMPLVVLINRESASASEIVAGAIQDNDRGWIVGEESFGKGLVQSVWSLPGGTGLTLTTAKYYTPSGRSIQREYNGVGLYDYYIARRHNALGAGASATEASPSPGRSRTLPSAASPARQDNPVFTPTGRELHGGGGITPDITVKLPNEDVRWRDACFEFARRLVGGSLPGLEQYKVTKTEYGYHLRGNEYVLTDQVLVAFRAFLREHPELRLAEAQINSHLDYIRRRIRAEIITAAYGVEAADQFLLESDVQALSAIAAIPKAKHLTDTARLFAPASERH